MLVSPKLRSAFSPATQTPSCEARNGTCHQIRGWAFPEVEKHAKNTAYARIDPEEVEPGEVSVAQGKAEAACEEPTGFR